MTSPREHHAELARAATPGPWDAAADSHENYVSWGVWAKGVVPPLVCGVDRGGSVHDAAHIAGNDPSIALAFNELWAAVDALVEPMKDYKTDHFYEPGDELMNVFAAEFDNLVASRSRLNALVTERMGS